MRGWRGTRVGVSQRLAISRRRATAGSVIASIVGSAARRSGARGRMTGAAGRAFQRGDSLRPNQADESLSTARNAMATNATVATRKISRCPRPGAGSDGCAAACDRPAVESGPDQRHLLRLRLRRRAVFGVAAVSPCSRSPARRDRSSRPRSESAGHAAENCVAVTELAFRRVPVFASPRSHPSRRRWCRRVSARVCSAGGSSRGAGAGARAPRSAPARSARSVGAARRTFWFAGPRYQQRRRVGRSSR